jgi:hypothetical protein
MKKTFITLLILTSATLGFALTPSSTAHACLLLDGQVTTTSQGQSLVKYKAFQDAWVQPDGSILGEYYWEYKIPVANSGYELCTDNADGGAQTQVIPNLWGVSAKPGDYFSIDFSHTNNSYNLGTDLSTGDITYINGVSSINHLQQILDVDTPNNINSSTSNSINVYGWTLNTSGTKQVDVLVDGVEEGIACLGVSRPDVNLAYGSFNETNSGYYYKLDTSNFSNGQHNLTVKATGNDGSVSTKNININVNRPQQLLCVDTPSNGSNVLNSVNIAGWTLNVSGTKQVNVLVDGVAKGTATLGVARPDVANVYPAYNNANSGYNFTLDLSTVSDGNHTITVQSVGNDGNVSTQNINVVRPNPITDIDSPHGTITGNSVNVGGWALNPSGVKEADVLVDGVEKGVATLGVARPDVANAFPAYDDANSGYNYKLDLSSVSAGNHTITVKVLGDDGSIATNSTNINVNSPQQLLCVDTPTDGGNILNSVNISGWTLDISGTKQVDILVDGVAKGTATLGHSRPDVANAFPIYNNQNSGFSYSLDTSCLSHGKHILTVKSTGNDGSVSTEYILLVRPDAITDIDTAQGTVIGNSVNIGGWALNPSGVKEVDVLVNGVEKGTATLGVARPDVAKAFPAYNNANSGYNFMLDLSSVSAGNHPITVKAIGNDGSVSTQAINIIKPDSIMDIDTPHGTVTGTSVNVGGWALDPSGVKEVNVLVDGVAKGTATLGVARPDVANAFPVYNNSNSGYNYMLDLSSLSAGNHKITVEAIGNDGSVDNTCTVINVTK